MENSPNSGMEIWPWDSILKNGTYTFFLNKAKLVLGSKSASGKDTAVILSRLIRQG